MARDFLALWRFDTLDAARNAGATLDYAASNQYGRVQSGDTVWLVSLRDGHLRLVGRVLVAQVTDRAGAALALGTAGLWDAEHYILPAAGTAEPVRDIDIHHLAADLRFASPNDRLTLDTGGRVNGQQLQTMRVLSGNSSALLEAALQAL